MEKLTELPPLALATLGVTLGLLLAVRYLGIKFGSEKDPGTAATVAAVIVDSTALNRATDAIEDHTDALKEAARALDEVAKQMLIDREIARRRG